jgi:hypothetical protein
MTARNAATIASLALFVAVSACTSFYEVPIETPIAPKMDVSSFTRVLVAGFISGGSDEVDGNLETVRLLRSQLRSKSSLRVIESEVLPLAEMARDQVRTASVPAGAGDITPVADLAVADNRQNGDREEPRIVTEKDLERYNALFADVEFWKKIGEEYQNPLIVTGTVLFTPHQTAGFVVRNQEYYDSLGRREVRPVRMYMERKGFILTPKFIFIDGRTGTVLHSESMREERLYPTQQNTPALSSYFEMMDSIVPSFLGTLSMQRIRGTRILLR